MTEPELDAEQGFVDRAYERLDSLRRSYRGAQREVEGQGAWGTPQARTERDAIAAHYGDKAARLEQIEDRLVFGRIDSDDDATLYVGRAGLRDEDGGRLLVDWRAPAAKRFYQATPAQPDGLVRRRHIGTHLRKVVSVEDEVLNSQAARDSSVHFQGEGALMSTLARARDGHMGDILATIQAEQDAVIRSSSRGLLVVQGGPGTGKTAVALHRAAYLLYVEREKLARSGVLIVGPSKVFLRYIEKVLPSLGETGVVSLTMGELLPEISTQVQDTPEVTKAKGSLAWIPLLKLAVQNLERVPAEPVTVSINGRLAVLTPEAVASARTRARRSGKPHNEAREGFALELMESLARQFSEDDEDPETIHWWLEEIRSSIDARRAINLCWMPQKPTDLLAKLYSRPDLLSRLAQQSSGTPGYLDISEADLRLVHRPKSAPWTVADIPLLDELEELLGYSSAAQVRKERGRAEREKAEIERARQAIEGQNLGGGIVSAQLLAQETHGEHEWTPLVDRARKDRSWTYGHIVVDEAQDLTPMAWHALMRRCPSQSFTVVGDLDQARGSSRPQSWHDALGPAARALANEIVLTISYRTPQQVMDFAQSIMADLGEPVLFPVTSARSVDNSLTFRRVATNESIRTVTANTVSAEEKRLDASVGTGLGRVGVIVPDRYTDSWQADSKGVTGLKHRVSVLTATGSKGLEFDTVIVVDPSAILEQGIGDLFVALTRCTTRLSIIHEDDHDGIWSPT